MNERVRNPIWPIPIALAIGSVVGLVSALIGDGAWDAVSWICLGVPVAVAGWYSLRK